MATWAVSSEVVQDHFGAKSANWLAVRTVDLVSNFINSSRVEPWNEAENFLSRVVRCTQRKNHVDVESTSTSVSQGPQSFGVMYQSIPSLTITPGDPRDSHIIVAPGVGFSLLCLARGFARGVLNQSKSLIILKKARFLLCLLNN